LFYVFENTKAYIEDETAKTLNKKIVLLILGGLINDRLYKLNREFKPNNKLFKRVKRLCLKNYEIYLSTINQHNMKNNIKDQATFTKMFTPR